MRRAGPHSKKSEHFFSAVTYYVNRRHDDHREPLLRYCVRAQSDLRGKIIPFFLKFHLRTAKREDFQKFVVILQLMERKVHKDLNGLKRIAMIIKNMNRRETPRFLKSSETTRRSPAISRGEDMVLRSQGNEKRNSLTGEFRPARMA